MMGYDVDCQISKGKKRSTIEFIQHPDHHTALTFGIADEKLDNDMNTRWNEKYYLEPRSHMENPIKTVEGAKEILQWLKSEGFKVGNVK